MTTPEKQQKINDFLQKFITMSAFDDKSDEDLAISICETLDSVKNNQEFLPRYYTISNKLLELKSQDYDKYDRSSSLKELLTSSKKFLDSITSDHPLCEQHPTLKTYCLDTNFKHLVNEFYSSAQHEIIIYEASINATRTNELLDITKRFEATTLDSMQNTMLQLKNLKRQIDKTEKKVNKNLASAERTLTDSQQKLVYANEKLEKAELKLKQADNMLPSLLTTLGIFISIIIAIVVIYLSIIIADNSDGIIQTFLSATTTYARIIVILFLGLFSFDLLFVFVYWISKIANRSIACQCLGCGEDGKCKPNKCKTITRVFKRYWNFLLVNILTTIIICMLIFCHYNVIHKNHTNENNSDISVTETTAPPSNVKIQINSNFNNN